LIGGYRAIALIVGLALVVAAASSFFEVEAHQNLVTVLSGDVLVASVAIFSAAVTAAIYAKPAFDDALARARPADLALQLSIVNFGVEVPRTTTVDGDVFTVGRRPATVS